MDNIEEILRALTEDEPNGLDSECSQTAESSESGGLFDGLDMEMLMKMMSLFEEMKKPNDNERFLLALRPLLREENRPKIDSAIKLLKLFSMLPVLKESGLLGKML